MTGEERHVEPCRQCGSREYDGDLDPYGWCAECRTGVVRSAGRIARIIAILTAGGTGLMIAWTLDPSPRFLVAWAAVLVLVYIAVLKIVQRVAFDIIRSRRARPPEPL